MVEHILRGFAKVDNPFAQCWRHHAEGHVLRIVGAGRMVIAANSANAAGDEMCVPRIFALHENAVPAEDRRRAMTLDDVFVGEINFRKDAQASDDSGDRVPIHLHDLLLLARGLCMSSRSCAHRDRSFNLKLGPAVITGRQFSSGMPPLRFFVESGLGDRPQCSDPTPKSA